jgi:hypothetical protein
MREIGEMREIGKIGEKLLPHLPHLPDVAKEIVISLKSFLFIAGLSGYSAA